MQIIYAIFQGEVITPGSGKIYSHYRACHPAPKVKGHGQVRLEKVSPREDQIKVSLAWLGVFASSREPLSLKILRYRKDNGVLGMLQFSSFLVLPTRRSLFG